MNTARQLLEADRQGKRFSDVVSDSNVPFDQVLLLLDVPENRRRMIEAESIHGRPALAGIVKELEAIPAIDSYFRTRDAHETVRFRQAVGVAVRVVMEGLGWQTTGRKGSLGVRVKVPAGTTAPGAYRNHPGGHALWFSKAEHYRPAVAPEPTADRDGSARPPGLTPDEFRLALARIEQIGSPEEREETLDLLLKGLAESRRAEGRPVR